jgi:hypothetical protein
MKETSYTAKEWYAGRLAVPHGPKGEKPIDVATTWNGADLLRTTIGDYAKFEVSVMHDDALTKEIAAQRSTMTRDLVKPEPLDKIVHGSWRNGTLHDNRRDKLGMGSRNREWSKDSGPRRLRSGSENVDHVRTVGRNRIDRSYEWREWEGGHPKSLRDAVPGYARQRYEEYFGSDLPNEILSI